MHMERNNTQTQNTHDRKQNIQNKETDIQRINERNKHLIRP